MTVINVDYLNFTVPSGGRLPGAALAYAVGIAWRIAPRLIAGEVEPKGIHGYAWSSSLSAPDSQDRAIVAAGGANPETVLFSFTGGACSYLDLAELEKVLNEVGGRITRVDLALDDFEGLHTVHEVREAYLAGDFRNRGQMPASEMGGPWDCPERWSAGLTYYIGKIRNGKTLCVYEKGKQTGDPSSPWVRFEVRLSRQDRDIPNDVLSKRAEYFFGSYPWLAHVADVPGEFLGLVTREKTRISILHLVTHCKKSYGKVLNALRHLGVSSGAIVANLASAGLPSRVNMNFLTPEVGSGVLSHLDRAGGRAWAEC